VKQRDVTKTMADEDPAKYGSSPAEQYNPLEDEMYVYFSLY
jgi:hypothetical protein